MADLTGKALEFLQTAVPRASRFGVLWSPTAPSYRPTLQAALTAAKKLGVELQMLPMSTAADIDVAFARCLPQMPTHFLSLPRHSVALTATSLPSWR